jgi:hypothetical protein
MAYGGEWDGQPVRKEQQGHRQGGEESALETEQEAAQNDGEIKEAVNKFRREKDQGSDLIDPNDYGHKEDDGQNLTQIGRAFVSGPPGIKAAFLIPLHQGSRHDRFSLPAGFLHPFRTGTAPVTVGWFSPLSIGPVFFSLEDFPEFLAFDDFLFQQTQG